MFILNNLPMSLSIFSSYLVIVQFSPPSYKLRPKLVPSLVQVRMRIAFNISWMKNLKLVENLFSLFAPLQAHNTKDPKLSYLTVESNRTEKSYK